MLSNHLIHQASHLDRFDQFFWHRLRFQAIKPWIADSENLLDIGAGTGQVGRYLRNDKQTTKYHYYEKIKEVADLAVSKGKIENQLTSLENLEHFDTLICLDVIEHIEDDRGFVKDIIDKMTHGAQLIITVPAHNFLWSAWDHRLGHFRRYSKATLSSLFNELPVEVKKCRYLFPELLPLALFRKIKKSKSNAEFPELHSAVNNFFYLIGKGSLNLISRTPCGTSLCIVVKKVSKES